MEPKLLNHLRYCLLQLHFDGGEQIRCQLTIKRVINTRARPKNSDGGLLAREEGGHPEGQEDGIGISSERRCQ